MLAQIDAMGLMGTEVQRVRVEVDVSSGLPGWQIVGLPETAVKESKERVTAAIRNSGIQLIARKITVNLAPAQWKKSGAFFDLPIALGLLVASEILTPAQVEGVLCIGELTLKGDVLGLPGILPMVMAARADVVAQRLRHIVIPGANVAEAMLVRGLPIVGVTTLQEMVRYVETGEVPPQIKSSNVSDDVSTSHSARLDLADVRGQFMAKRALLVAAAGGHNLIMLSPPGSGKTMLAERLPSILPMLSEDQSLDTSRIYSIAGKLSLQMPVVQRPPFCAPHHSASVAAVCGGGNGMPSPGELSLAHNGVLFMDELPEFRRDILEALREPLESGSISISRSRQRITFPARFQLVAAMNPCPCGYYGHPKISCQCSLPQILGYRRRVSGPLLDRIDLQVVLQPVSGDELLSETREMSSQEMMKSVVACRAQQQQRFESDAMLNSHIPTNQISKYCALDKPCRDFVRQILKSGRWSARGFHRMLRVTRTIADLEGASNIRPEHVAEAIQYRQLDRSL